MTAAQSLYENGHITYMRTDSTNLAKVAIDAARDLVRTEYGADYLPANPGVYETKVKNAQEAHEAIRPAGTDFPAPQSLKHRLKSDEWKLYDLIWKRTVSSQMADARKGRSTIAVEGGGATFQEFFSRNTVSGVQGQPTLGTAEKGARVFAAAVSRLASFLEEFRRREIRPRRDLHDAE